MIEGKSPSLGYHIIALLAENEIVKSVWTTNFDGLMLKTAHSYGLVPIEVTLESQDRIFRNNTDKELLCIALHGDYKYGPLKNTETELDNQSEVLVRALTHEIEKRNAFYVPTDGFDKTMLNIAGKIESAPILKDVFLNNKTFREMLLRVLVTIIGKYSGCEYNKNKIWRKSEKFSQMVEGKKIIAYRGIQFSLFSDGKYNYLAFIPAYFYENKKASKSTRFGGFILPVFIKMSFSGKIRYDKMCLDIFCNVREMFSMMF